MHYRLLLLIDLLYVLIFSLFGRKQNKLFLIGTPIHGNLGDQAIALSICDYLKQRHIFYIEINGSVYRKFTWVLNKLIKKTDAICICGGGFLGSLWTEEDDMVTSIIEKFQENKIIIAPQSIFFDKNDSVRIEKTKKVYCSHKNLNLFVREKNSFVLCKKLFKGTNIHLVPDMVFLLKDFCKQSFVRPDKKILLCFRSDKEHILDDKVELSIKNKIIEMGFEYDVFSTVVPYVISSFSRKKEIQKILKKVSSAKLIITDRLHAMLFSYITETPCYVFDNASHKISGVHEWIKDCVYIKYCESFDESTISFDLPSGKSKDFSEEFKPLFEKLEMVL